MPDNAIYRLAAALQRLAAYTFPIALNDATRFISPTKTPEYLLASILDPNGAIDNNYFSYTIVDIDGERCVLSSMLDISVPFSCTVGACGSWNTTSAPLTADLMSPVNWSWPEA